MSSAAIKNNSKKILETVKMSEWADKKIGKFSKGMKQRIALAQALLHEPELLILDEPTTGLDPRGMAEVRDVIRSVKKEGYTVFMSSHLLNEVQEVCDRVALIDRGKLLVYESVDVLSSRVSVEKIEVTSLNDITPPVIEKMKVIPGLTTIAITGTNNLALSFSYRERLLARERAIRRGGGAGPGKPRRGSAAACLFEACPRRWKRSRGEGGRE